MKPLFVATAVCAACLSTAAVAQTARFTDDGGVARIDKLRAAFPEIEKVFQRYHDSRKTPGSAWGIIIDGQLVYTKTFGVREKKTNSPATADTAFRIASMTKSFTAAAVLKLRDEGKLSLDDKLEKWIPAFKNYKYPSADSEALTVRHILSHNAGFPEDNPWGDRQMGEPLNSLDQWVKKGIPFSTTPGTTYEYSNYGFALAGEVVARASGMPYRQYVETKILKPLGMTASSLEPEALPANARATGYGLRGNEEYFEIPSLKHGSFGAMGGLVTTVNDLAKWIAFQLDAFPPRDDKDSPVLSRASRREMQKLWRTGNFAVDREPRLRATSGGYGYGLGVSQDCRFGHIVGHGGGLPGFGSYMMWLPEYGVGMIAMTNLTYSGPSQALSEAFDVLLRTGALQPRVLPPAPVLTSTRDSITGLWNNWDDKKLEQIAANNLLMDLPAADRRQDMEEVRKQVGGNCRAPGAVVPENLLRGAYRMACDRGEVEVSFTLAPTNPPSVQFLNFRPIVKPTAPMQALLDQSATKAGCKLSKLLGGDGTRVSVGLLECAAGQQAMVAAQIDANGKETSQLRRAPGARCAP
jgi:CubicO group peptidase (beta-lactamase class C family)